MLSTLMQQTDLKKLRLPENETERVLDLLSLDLDYSALEDDFDTLTSLAAQVTGTQFSLLNLIDMYAQWTVSGYGLPIQHMARENSVCQYTILEQDHFEVKDLQQDERFRNLPNTSLQDGTKLRYYMGVPLRTPAGHNIGALCVIDTDEKSLTAEQLDVLQKIASEIVKRLLLHKKMQDLRRELAEATALNKRVAHDIRGPIGGIQGLAQLLSRKLATSTPQESAKMIGMIEKSATSLLAMADEIMQEKYTQSAAPADGLTLSSFKNKLEEIFRPQAIDKGIDFDITINQEKADINFTKNKLLQVAVNLISNALKFTPPLGQVRVALDLTFSQNHRVLCLTVSDTGIGLAPDQVQAIMSGSAASTSGTSGEQGYGLGLQLVRKLLAQLYGTMQVESSLGEGTTFALRIPIGSVNHLA